MFFFYTAYRAVRRAMEKDQRRPVSPRTPMWRLLGEETAILVRHVGRWRVTLVVGSIAAAVLLAEILLSDMTPGPVFDPPWRWVVAAFAAGLALGAWAVIHAVRATGEAVQQSR